MRVQNDLAVQYLSPTTLLFSHIQLVYYIFLITYCTTYTIILL